MRGSTFENPYTALTRGWHVRRSLALGEGTTGELVEPQLDDTQGIDVSIGVDQEIAGLLERLQLLLAEDDPRHRLLAAVASMWHDPPASAQRFQAAANLLTLDQRDVWFLAASDPVEAMDEAVSRLLIALGDAVTAAGANFYFDTGEPFTPAGNAAPPRPSSLASFISRITPSGPSSTVRRSAS